MLQVHARRESSDGLPHLALPCAGEGMEVVKGMGVKVNKSVSRESPHSESSHLFLPLDAHTTQSVEVRAKAKRTLAHKALKVLKGLREKSRS